MYRQHDLVERDLRGWQDELLVEIEHASEAGPLTPENRWRGLVEAWESARAEADHAGVPVPRHIEAAAEEAFDLVAQARREDAVERFADLLPDVAQFTNETHDGDLVLRLAIENNDLAWATTELEEHVRFDSFSAEEAARRREFAASVRRHAQRRVERHGGSYRDARRQVLSDRLRRLSGGHRPTATARPRDRRVRTSRRTRAPTADPPDEPEPPRRTDVGGFLFQLLRGLRP